MAAAEDPDPSGSGISNFLGNLKALLDAIHKEDDRIGGLAVTRLTAFCAGRGTPRITKALHDAVDREPGARGAG